MRCFYQISTNVIVRCSIYAFDNPFDLSEMDNLWFGLIPSTYSNYEVNITVTCCGIHKNTNHTPVKTLVVLFILWQINMSGTKFSFEASILYPKFLPNVLGIFNLGNKNIIFNLFHLEAKEIGNLTNHDHYKFCVFIEQNGPHLVWRPSKHNYQHISKL